MNVMPPASLVLRAAAGWIRANHAEQACSTVERVRGILAAAQRSPEAPLLLESYLPGMGVALEGLPRGGRLEVLAVFDKPDPLEGPYFEETLYVTPSELRGDVLTEVKAVAARAARALGLREGPVHAELRVDGERVSVLELAARSIGGLCSRALQFGAGVTLEQVILRHAMGLRLEDLARESTASGVMMIPIPGAGVLRAVEGQQEARAVEGIGGLEITISRGRPVVPLPDGDRYLGFTTGTWDSCSRARRGPTRSNAPCAPLTPACGSGSSRLRPNRWAPASVRSVVRVLLISTYELGHQPSHLASPAAALRLAGHDVRCLDLSVQPWDPGALEWAKAVGFSVPMHTAMRLARTRPPSPPRAHPELPLCFYGLYATVSRELVEQELDARAIAGEYEPALAAWVNELGAAPDAVPAAERPIIQLQRSTFEPPARELLPGLERYARLAGDGEERLVGYVEASHGCVHRCRHCPVPTVYDGRIRIVQAEIVLRDIEHLADMGARHNTFGDPDFLNGWRHSLAIVRALHERRPELTFDCTTKVEHVLEHTEVWKEMAASGCLFVVSALECVNDDILARLDKGHTTAQAVLAIDLLASTELRPGPHLCPSPHGQPRATCWRSSTSSPGTI